MSTEQTRQLGIEFERRIQTMIPSTEFTDKLDTETIYSFLNQCQDLIIRDLYRAIDTVPVSNQEVYIEKLLSTLLTETENLKSTGNDSLKEYTINNLGLYVSSYSHLTEAYNNKEGFVNNNLIAYKDSDKFRSMPHDDMRILRHPVCWITDNKLFVKYDRYSNPDYVKVSYYRMPKYMNPLTSTNCELPMEMFEQLVSGAVDLYVQYVAGAEANKRRLDEQRRQLQRNNKEGEE